MNRVDLFNQIKKKNSYLCIGLDPDLEKLPVTCSKNLDGVLEFLHQIIEATQEFCVAYKPNTAFYESLGKKGWELLEETFKMIPNTHFLIADAKRGDIFNTSIKYAEAFFNPHPEFRVDAITLNPFMGFDSVKPFLKYPNKWLVILALTSNSGVEDFQMLKLQNGDFLYEEILKKAKTWGDTDQIMFVVGATRAEQIKSVRNIVPEHFLLVPGIGVQDGDLEKISEAGLNSLGGLLINASRSILYASPNADYAYQARESAKGIQKEMEFYLQKFCYPLMEGKYI